MKKICLLLSACAMALSLSSCATKGGTVTIPLNDKGGALEFDWEVLEDK